MAEQPTGACSEAQIQSVVRSIFGELFVTEQSGSNSRQHSSVTSEINERFRLPRNAAPQPQTILTQQIQSGTANSSGSIGQSSGQSSGQSIPQPVNVPHTLSAAVPSFNAQINYGNPSLIARSVPVRPQRSQNRRSSYYRRNRATSASQSSNSERNEVFMKDVCLLPQACNKVPRCEAKTKLQNEGCFVDAFVFYKRWDEPTLWLKILSLFSNMLDGKNRYNYNTQSYKYYFTVHTALTMSIPPPPQTKRIKCKL
jgi:hypothetical protein